MFESFSQRVRSSVGSVVGRALGISNPDESYNEGNNGATPKARQEAMPDPIKRKYLAPRSKNIYNKKYESMYSDLERRFNNHLSSGSTDRFIVYNDNNPPASLTSDEQIEFDAKEEAQQNFNKEVVIPHYEFLKKNNSNAQPGEPLPQPQSLGSCCFPLRSHMLFRPPSCLA